MAFTKCKPPQHSPLWSLQVGYLAQHPLFEQIPALAGDIQEPQYCALGEGDVRSVNAWFGPPGTVSWPSDHPLCHSWEQGTMRSVYP